MLTHRIITIYVGVIECNTDRFLRLTKVSAKALRCFKIPSTSTALGHVVDVMSE